MPVCALCENQQDAGESCDVCGRPFPAAERTETPVERLAELEPTLVDAGEARGIDGAEGVEGLEQTRLGPVEVVAGVLEGLEPTVAEGIPDDLPTPEPAAVCRYCRTPAAPGEAFCAHCGMRLPATGGPLEAPLPVVLCRDCGTPVRGAACPSCGVVPGR